MSAEPKALPDPVPFTAPVAEIPFELDATAVLRRFHGASRLELDAESEVELSTPFADDEVELLPAGEPYAPHGRYRERLNDVFGPGQWALLPLAEHQEDVNAKKPERTKIYLVQQWGLFVRGALVSIAWGESGAETADSTLAQMLEAAKSNALTRACKDLGIGLLLADKRWGAAFRERVGVLVESKLYPRDDWRAQWRRFDGVPYPFEGKVIRKPGAAPEPAPASIPGPSASTGAPAEPQAAPTTTPPADPGDDVKGADDKYLDAMAAQRKRVGTEVYLKVLSRFGVTAAGQLRGRAKRSEIYKALEALPAKS